MRLSSVNRDAKNPPPLFPSRRKQPKYLILLVLTVIVERKIQTRGKYKRDVEHVKE